MRILFLTGALPPTACGVGDYTARLIQSLSIQPGVVIGVAYPAATLSPDPIPGVEFLPVSRWRPRHLFGLLIQLRRWRPDRIHLQYPTQGLPGPMHWYALIAATLLGVPTFITLHESPPHHLITKLALALVSVVILVRSDLSLTAELRPRDNLWRWWLGRRTTRIIPIGSNIPAVKPEASRETWRRRLGLNGQRLLVGFGLMYPEHGFEQLLDLADPAQDFVVLAGNSCPTLPEYFEELQRQCSSPTLAGHTRFLGPLPADEIAALLHAADAVVLPYLHGGHEGKGAILAARAQGTLVVTTHTTKRGYSPDDHTCFAAPNDVAALRTMIEAYAGKRSNTASRVVPNWDKIALAHLALYAAESR